MLWVKDFPVVCNRFYYFIKLLFMFELPIGRIVANENCLICYECSWCGISFWQWIFVVYFFWYHAKIGCNRKQIKFGVEWTRKSTEDRTKETVKVRMVFVYEGIWRKENKFCPKIVSEGLNGLCRWKGETIFHLFISTYKQHRSAVWLRTHRDNHNINLNLDEWARPNIHAICNLCKI